MSVIAPAAQPPQSVIASRPVATTVRNKPAEREYRIANQPAFVLHSYPYKETSLIVDAFSRDYGRVALMAKGAKRPHSKLRGALQTFQPLQLGWSGKSEVRTLIAAEWIGGLLPLERAALLCGFYLNELLVRLLARDDPERGPREAYVSDTAPVVSGKTLIDMAREDYSDATTQSQSKFLMRALLAHHLGGAPLNTRQILIDLLHL